MTTVLLLHHSQSPRWLSQSVYKLSLNSSPCVASHAAHQLSLFCALPWCMDDVIEGLVKVLSSELGRYISASWGVLMKVYILSLLTAS